MTEPTELRSYWVLMQVSTVVNATSKEDAMQKACDVVHPLVVESRLGVNSVERAIDVDEGTTAADVLASLREDPHYSSRPANPYLEWCSACNRYDQMTALQDASRAVVEVDPWEPWPILRDKIKALKAVLDA